MVEPAKYSAFHFSKEFTDSALFALIEVCTDKAEVSFRIGFGKK